ncbi:MAG TPA: DUF4199 domain-containing protein [Opitutaceae bacterium]|jgi:hypothetical protein|nr:DUF4199 domain-containing protein [Opitutaceae bacterium]
MKPTLLYGFLLSAAGLLLQVILTLSGYYSDAQKFSSGQTIGSVAGLVIGILFLVLGIRACRAQVPANEGYSYGRAFGSGALITLWNALFGIVFTILFLTLINPDFPETLRQMQLDKIAASGRDPSQAEGFLRVTTSIPMIVGFGFIFTVIIGLILTLIVAVFLRREPPRVPPPAPVAA